MELFGALEWKLKYVIHIVGRPCSLIGEISKGLYCFVAAKLDEFYFKTFVTVQYKGVCEAGYSHQHAVFIP